jgi:outer membrane biosynthesis protein TonB
MTSHASTGGSGKGPTTEAGRAKLQEKLKARQDKENRRIEKNKKKNQKKKERKKKHAACADDPFERIVRDIEDKARRADRRERKQKAKRTNNKAKRTNNQSNNQTNEQHTTTTTTADEIWYNEFKRLLKQAELTQSTTMKKEYRRLSLTYHPDKNPENAQEFTEIFKYLQKAYEDCQCI